MASPVVNGVFVNPIAVMSALSNLAPKNYSCTTSFREITLI